MPLPTRRSLHIDAALTNLSVAYFQEAPPISDLVFPRVPVDYQTDKYFVWDKADFWRDDAQKRAPGTKFPRIGARLSTDSYRTDEYALEYPIADEDAANADAALRLKQTATRLVTSRLNMRKDRQFAADFFKTGVWGTDLTGVAATPGANQFLQWDQAASDPSSVLQTATELILDALGDDADTMRIVALTSSNVRAALRNNADVIDRIQYTQAATPRAIDDVLAAYLGVDSLLVARRRYTTSAEGAATATYADVFGKHVLLVAVPNGPAMETPSAGYTFEWNEGGRGPMYVEDYRDETIKSDIIRGVAHFDQKAVAPTLGVFLADVIA